MEFQPDSAPYSSEQSQITDATELGNAIYNLVALRQESFTLDGSTIVHVASVERLNNPDRPDGMIVNCYDDNGQLHAIEYANYHGQPETGYTANSYILHRFVEPEEE